MNRAELARRLYEAFAAGDREYVERALTGDRARGRNTEVLTFRDEQICRAEVYFGWTVGDG